MATSWDEGMEGWMEGWRDGGMERWRDGEMEGGMREPRGGCCVVFRALPGPWSSLGGGGWHSRRRFPHAESFSSMWPSALVCVYEGDALGEC